MRLRRVRTATGLETQAEHAPGRWQAVEASTTFGPSPFDETWQVAVADRHLQLSDSLLPFTPLSFRDFLLSEQHNVDASRGLLRRFHPRSYRATRVFERITRQTYPGFRPRPLFYREPVYYFGNAMTVVPTGTAVAFPSYSHGLDFELELAWVLKAPLCDSTPDEALDAIGAFVLLNDISARDVQRAEMRSGLGPQKAKHFLSSMSATAVTADEVLPQVEELTGTVAINGRVVSRVSTKHLRWSLGEVLAHASKDERLLAGEMFATGTLPGGSGMETGCWLRPGDTLQLTLDGIGDVEHHILDRCRGLQAPTRDTRRYARANPTRHPPGE